jgi:hypothetical protein
MFDVLAAIANFVTAGGGVFWLVTRAARWRRMKRKSGEDNLKPEGSAQD